MINYIEEIYLPEDHIGTIVSAYYDNLPLYKRFSKCPTTTLSLEEFEYYINDSFDEINTNVDSVIASLLGRSYNVLSYQMHTMKDEWDSSWLWAVSMREI